MSSLPRRHEINVSKVDKSPPGVYVFEVSSGERPITAIGTSTAGFIGVAPQSKNLKGEAKLITNWTQFRKEYITPATAGTADPKWTMLAHAVYGFFLNGGSRCYVVNAAKGANEAAGIDHNAALKELETVDEINFVAVPGYKDPFVIDALKAHCEKMQDRVGIVDALMPEEAYQGLNNATPPVPATLKAPADLAADYSKIYDVGRTPNGYVTAYFPDIVVSDPSSDTFPPATITVPPSGHVAGVWARADATRGVHKAPANEQLNGALAVAKRITRTDQGFLNTSGINVIKHVAGAGHLVMGARTLSSDEEYRYINVRRLMLMIEESLQEGTRWIVFEPNNEELWSSIRRDVTAFLTEIWRTGALMGTTPDEAFFVKCDAENNDIDSRRKGAVIIDVGVAPTYPAEFVIFRIGQYRGGVDADQG